MAVRLFIECKFISSNSVFWLADKDQESAHKLVCASGPFRETNNAVGGMITRRTICSSVNKRLAS